jgi:hypothetical protein
VKKWAAIGRPKPYYYTIHGGSTGKLELKKVNRFAKGRREEVRRQETGVRSQGEIRTYLQAGYLLCSAEYFQYLNSWDNLLSPDSCLPKMRYDLVSEPDISNVQQNVLHLNPWDSLLTPVS